MSAYTDEEVNEMFSNVLKRIESGESVKFILDNYSDTPSRDTFYKWLKERDGFADNYARACEVREEQIFDDILTIADENNADVSVSEDGAIKIDGNAIQRSKLKIDARKWVLSKMNPKKYGDKLDVTTNGDSVNMSEEERQKRINELLLKAKSNA
ncbi:terminase small subunit-like protein [Joostella sp. CR20]|uniref:terminase small subunit-like protein n=1 Tax=Joostella sp. CR20 TaxID=2804312 RepID=UPI00313E3D20